MNKRISCYNTSKWAYQFMKDNRLENKYSIWMNHYWIQYYLLNLAAEKYINIASRLFVNDSYPNGMKMFDWCDWKAKRLKIIKIISAIKCLCMLL